MTDERLRLATAELLGALTYGQMRAYAAAAQVAPTAPELADAEQLLRFSERERDRYEALRARLGELTDLPAGVVDRQREAFDRYFSSLPLDSWLGALVFLAVSLPMAADFGRAVAPTLDDRTAEVVLDALLRGGEIEAFAHERLRELLGDPETAARARAMVADVTGAALTAFTGALGETDALRDLFARRAETTGTPPDDIGKRITLGMLEEHRRRMLALGLDELE